MAVSAGPPGTAPRTTTTTGRVRREGHATDAVLWDLDGTLVDSADDHFDSWLEALGAEGRTVTRGEFEATFGQRNDRILERWLGPDATPDLTRRIAEAKETAYRRLVHRRGLLVLPGAERWVRHLHEAGRRQAIVTSAPRANVDAVLDVLGWHGFFEAIITAEDVGAGKPDPEAFLKAAGRLGVPPARCVVVEDAAAGVEAARRGGMRSIGVGAAALDGAPDLAVASLAALTPDVWD